MVSNNNQKITSYRDLRVYQNLYSLMLVVLKQITPKLPTEEKFDLKQQMMRASKAPLALLAEGFAKRYQPKNWDKYINDCLGEVYEMINHLTICVDVYDNHVDTTLCNDLIERYNFASKQLYKLRVSWQNFHKQ